MRLRLPVALFMVLQSWTPLAAQERPLVVIDPGHGGDEVGVVAGDVLEKDLVLEVAMSIGAEFVRAGYDVAFTRTRDVNVGWDERRALADDSGAVALFMLHAMRSDDPSVSGAELYFDESDTASTALADAVADQMRAMGSNVLVDPRPWPFLQSRIARTVMIEAAHLTHPDEGAQMADPAFHHELGRALVAALASVEGG